MNRMKTTLLFAPVLGAMLVACSTQVAGNADTASPPDTPSRPTPAEPVVGDAANASADCIVRGGQLIKVGRLQREVCAMPYPDAGKQCSDDADCAGTCRSEATDVATGSPATGTCQRHDHDKFGCYTRIEGGKAGAAICVD